MAPFSLRLERFRVTRRRRGVDWRLGRCWFVRRVRPTPQALSSSFPAFLMMVSGPGTTSYQITNPHPSTSPPTASSSSPTPPPRPPPHPDRPQLFRPSSLIFDKPNSIQASCDRVQRLRSSSVGSRLERPMRMVRWEVAGPVEYAGSSIPFRRATSVLDRGRRAGCAEWRSPRQGLPPPYP